MPHILSHYTSLINHNLGPMAGSQIIFTTRVSLTANGTSLGVLTVPDTTVFPQFSRCWLNGTSLPELEVIVSRVLTSTTLQVRAATLPINQLSNVSAYTTAASSTLTINPQTVGELT
jgi:hypothetical protein